MLKQHVFLCGSILALGVVLIFLFASVSVVYAHPGAGHMPQPGGVCNFQCQDTNTTGGGASNCSPSNQVLQQAMNRPAPEQDKMNDAIKAAHQKCHQNPCGTASYSGSGGSGQQDRCKPMMGMPPKPPMLPKPMPKMMMMMPMPMPCSDPTQLANLGEDAQRQCGEQATTTDPLSSLFDTLPTSTATTTEDENESALEKLAGFFGFGKSDEDEGPATVVTPTTANNINDGTTEEITTLMPNVSGANPLNLSGGNGITGVIAGNTFGGPTRNVGQEEPQESGVQAAVQGAAGFAQAVAEGVFGGVNQVSNAVIQAANNILGFLSGGAVQI